MMPRYCILAILNMFLNTETKVFQKLFEETCVGCAMITVSGWMIVISRHLYFTIKRWWQGYMYTCLQSASVKNWQCLRGVKRIREVTANSKI